MFTSCRYALDHTGPCGQTGDAKVPALILAAEIANTAFGTGRPDSFIAIGRAVNADYVLTGMFSKLGEMNLFDMKILNVTTGEQIKSADRDYRGLSDG